MGYTGRRLEGGSWRYTRVFLPLSSLPTESLAIEIRIPEFQLTHGSPLLREPHL
jgi:hypothetical protein